MDKKERTNEQQCLVTSLGMLEEALTNFDPHVVICSRPSSEYPSGGRGAWVELPAEPTETGEVCLGGDYEETVDPQLVKVLSVLDEAEERLRRGTLAESC